MPKVKQFDREKVLETASSIFHHKGYNGTSIDEILKATGLSRSSLYDSFKDKHTLYLQSLEFYKNKEMQLVEGIDHKKMNGLQKIESLFKEVLNQINNHPEDNGSLLVNAAAEMSKRCTMTNQVVVSGKEGVQDLLTLWLAEAEKENVLKLSKPAKSYGTFLFNTICGLKIMSQSGASKAEMQNIVKVTLDALN